MYEGTRGNIKEQTASQAIVWGMVPGGGLFVPTQIPSLDWQSLTGLNYRELAIKVMGEFLPDFTLDDLKKAASVYNAEAFGGEDPAPLVNVDNMGILELWHGPTSAFKDMALQALPYLLRTSLDNIKETAQVLILVATSGDTGKAALEGFKNVAGTEIMALYPDNGVSTVQEQQMVTTGGKNTYVVAVEGNFDQCQTAVKKCFASQEMKEKLAAHHRVFSSANSINWGRLLPQIVYYIWTYIKAVEQGSIQAGTPLNVVVPTGNFGNLLAAYYAKRMGIPLGKLICASNQNNVLADFFIDGEYDSKRPFYQTISPSMDILISSNFERFLYEMSGRDGEKVTAWYHQLGEEGRFKVDPATLERCRATVYAGWADEKETQAMIHKMYTHHGYVVDPHTAVGIKVYEDYCRETGDDTYTVVASTASPFKFASTVLKNIAAVPAEQDEWKALEDLSRETGWKIPQGLQGLEKLPAYLAAKCGPEEVSRIIEEQILS